MSGMDPVVAQCVSWLAASVVYVAVVGAAASAAVAIWFEVVSGSRSLAGHSRPPFMSEGGARVAEGRP